MYRIIWKGYIIVKKGKGWAKTTWSVGSSSTSPPVTKRARGKLVAVAPIKGLGRGAPGAWGRNCFSSLIKYGNKRISLVGNMLCLPKRWHQAKGFPWCRGKLSCNNEVTAFLGRGPPTLDFHMPGCLGRGKLHPSQSEPEILPSNKVLPLVVHI